MTWTLWNTYLQCSRLRVTEGNFLEALFSRNFGLSRIPIPTPNLTFHQKLLRNKLMLQIHKNKIKNLSTTKSNPQITHFLGLMKQSPGPAVRAIPGSSPAVRSQTTPQAQNHNLHSDKLPGDSNAQGRMNTVWGEYLYLSRLFWPQEDYLEGLQYF